MVRIPFSDSKIKDLLENNGVGFVKCFFRSSLEPQEISENSKEEEWMLDFSDGKIYLGSLKFKNYTLALESIDGDTPSCTVSIDKQELGSEEHLEIEFTFTIYPYQCECLLHFFE